MPIPKDRRNRDFVWIVYIENLEEPEFSRKIKVVSSSIEWALRQAREFCLAFEYIKYVLNYKQEQIYSQQKTKKEYDSYGRERTSI